ncbi:MAG: acyl-homoserine-lactone synthase [Rhodospirillaceae bacterium]
MNVIVGKACGIRKDILFKMYEMRHEIFKVRMKWDVVERMPGIECDEFDDYDPLYGICVDSLSSSEIVILGCWRLLPTTGPYMLRDVFSFLLNGHPPENDARVWEISRFGVVADDGRGKISDSTISEATRLLLAELFKLGVQQSIYKFVACSDIRFHRILRIAGINVGTYGPSMPIGNTIAVGGWADVNDHLRLAGKPNNLKIAA